MTQFSLFHHKPKFTLHSNHISFLVNPQVLHYTLGWYN